MKVDVVIIGAGPAGSSVANSVASKGYKVLVIEKEKTIGCSPCAGYVSNTINLDGKLDVRAIQEKINCMRTYFPSGAYHDFPINGFVVDRQWFDKSLARRASANRAKFLVNASLHSLVYGHKNKGYCGVEFKKNGIKFVEARVIVGADGVFSKTAHFLGLKQKDVLIGAQYELSNLTPIPNTSEIFFDKNYAPGGYVWIYPIGKNGAKIGLGINKSLSAKSAFEYLDQFIEENPLVVDRLKNASQIAKISGAIPSGGILDKTCVENVLLVGDAAGMVDPITGAGISYAILTGEIAGKVISDALKKKDLSLLSQYETKWKKLLERTFTRSLKKRKFANTIYTSNEKLEVYLPRVWVTFKDYFRI